MLIKQRLFVKSLLNKCFKTYSELKKSGIAFLLESNQKACKAHLDEFNQRWEYLKFPEKRGACSSSNLSAEIPLYEYAEGTITGIAKEVEAFIKQNKIEMKISLLHSLAHIEFNAMKAYMDTLLRFGESEEIKGQGKEIEFTNDLVGNLL